MIPNVAHFIWLGSTLPYIYTLSIKSACINGNFDTVKLHGEPELLNNPEVAVLQEFANFTFCELNPDEILGSCSMAGLQEQFSKLSSRPADKANVLRLAILYREGGVYLDTDTITLKPLGALLETNAFVGEEYIIKPFWVVRSKSIGTHLQKVLRDYVRKFCAVVPHGYLLFDPLSKYYLKALNNAVVGSVPKSELTQTMLTKILEVPDSELRIRFRLGTHLLQETLREHPELATIHPPKVFYPLSPEISRHFFAKYGTRFVDRIITEETTILHWYASVKTKKVVSKADAEYIRKHASRELFSHIAQPFI